MNPNPHRNALIAAQVISTMFTPFFLPTVAFIVLLMFSYLRHLPFGSKLAMVCIVYLFTVLFPRMIIYAFRKFKGWTRHELSMRERRYVPYVICIICYSTLLALMESFHWPHFTLSIVSASLLIQIICAVVNKWVKVSVHAAASGGVIGMLFAFSLVVFNFDATWWIALCIFLSGCVCSARMVLRQHTYHELFFGVLIGLISGWGAVVIL